MCLCLLFYKFMKIWRRDENRLNQQFSEINATRAKPFWRWQRKTQAECIVNQRKKWDLRRTSKTVGIRHAQKFLVITYVHIYIHMCRGETKITLKFSFCLQLVGSLAFRLFARRNCKKPITRMYIHTYVHIIYNICMNVCMWTYV